MLNEGTFAVDAIIHKHENGRKWQHSQYKRMMTIQTKFTLLFGIITSFCGFGEPFRCCFIRRHFFVAFKIVNAFP